MSSPYEPLQPATLPGRLGSNPVLRERIGADPADWQVREVGDGNLNLVFIVEGPLGTAIVKQALPYIRLVGDSWPLTLRRTFFEFHALQRQAARDPGSVPAILHFDEAQALLVLEFLTPHVILRRELIRGRRFPKLAGDLGRFLARTLFRGSDLSLSASGRKQDLALFAANDELCAISENLVFSDPYFEAKLNRHTSPQLDALVAELRRDRDLKVGAQRLKQVFTAKAETLVHGDLHTGSIMVTGSETRVIDPEFAFYGPMAFDVGMLLANFWTAFFAQRGHEQDGPRDGMRRYLQETIVETWQVFRAEFSHLWRTERTGILYPRSVFEDRDDASGSEQALEEVLSGLWTDMLGFAGIEMHRRILGLAHNAEFETIADADLRARCEAAALKLGRHLVVHRAHLHQLNDINALAERLDTGAVA